MAEESFSTNQPTYQQTLGTTELRSAARRRVPGKRWVSEKRALMAELADAVSRRNLPPIPERAKDIFISAVGHLLNGGYSFELIRETAIAAALEYTDVRGYSKLTQIRLRVRAEATKAQVEEHTQQKIAESQLPVDPAVRDIVAGLVRQKIQQMRRMPERDTFRCANCGWQREADTCGRCKDLASWGIA